MKTRIFVLAVCMGLLAQLQTFAATAISGPLQLNVSTNGVKTVSWPRPLIPALETNKLSAGTTVGSFIEVNSSLINITTNGYALTFTNALANQFFKLSQGQMSSNALLTANVLNRLAYGPTPDELERVAAMGPQAYIDEQLTMESQAFVEDPIDAYSTFSTNSATASPLTPWTSVTVTGDVTSATFYMYLAGVGSLQMDSMQLRHSYTLRAVTNSGGISTTNISTILTSNLFVNGDFEQALTSGWTVSANMAGSFIDSSVASSGSSSLRMIASSPGSTQGSSIWQTVAAAPVTIRGTNSGTGEVFTNTVSNLRAILGFAYIQSPNSKLLTMRLSGSGLIINGTDQPPPPSWVYGTATGQATATPSLYVYLSGAGEVHIDDLKLVAGPSPGIGANLLPNGDFESGVLSPWLASPDFTNSSVSDTVAFAGNRSLRLVATAAGGGNGDSLYQLNIPSLVNGQTYTVSYWYTPHASQALTVRLSGSQLVSSPDTSAPSLRHRLETSTTSASLSDLRAWFCQRAVGAQGQLMEVLLQFFENHFVTQHSKTSDYLDRYYDGGILDRLSAALEYRENARWRQALTNPNCTFYDLLKVSAESPAMIIYLDTVGSRGDAANIANENYARELFELFCMGVDNGYDQNDIVAMSRAWTGWSVEIVHPNDTDNPLALRSTQYGFYPGSGFNAVSNLFGVWTFNYKTNFHGTNRAPILSAWNPNSPPGNPVALGPKIYPARFGAPLAGQSYQLVIPRRTGNAGIQDGYDVIRHLADVGFTQEYISVKLCRLFIHDDFEHGVYDYTDPNRSPEAELIHQCMVAWQTPGGDGRKGNIRSILRTIFSSDLFRSHGGSLQKIKTPLEFVASSVRALRSANPNGSFTATTDGYSFSSPLSRMGAMGLFNRADPDGYPESGAPWISAGTLAERLRFTQSYLTASTTAGRPTDAGNNFSDPVTLLKKKLPSGNWNNAGAVADYFLSILYPGEGKANLDLYRISAISFLNSADDGVTSSLFSGLSNTGTNYDTRVRGMVSLLMTTQRFQEQ